MLDELLSCDFRRQVVDDFGGGWKYSWHCMDHTGYSTNPRYKDLGYGNIFSHYRAKLKYSGSDELDELNWHFHPVAFVPDPTKNSTSYVNSYERLYNILSRRIIDDAWFPSVNRPGFHAERHDAHMFLEQWIPFDYANQAYEEEEIQPDFKGGRWGDWRRAPFSWRGYNPSHDDYQRPGHCRRFILRCLNLGSRLRILKHIHYDQAFNEARETGGAILSFSNHDYRDIRPDVCLALEMLQEARNRHPDVKVKFCGAEEAARALLGYDDKPPLKLKGRLHNQTFIVTVESGQIFGPQPFLAIKTKEGRYYHDNFDVVEPGRSWSYTLDGHSFDVASVDYIGCGSAGRWGGYDTVALRP